MVLLAASPAQALLPLPVFSDQTARSGIKFHHHGNPTPDKYLIETMCGGVGVLDYNNDGLLDIFLVNGGAFQIEGKQGHIDRSKPECWNRLYRNNGDGTFTDVTEEAGVSGAESKNFGMGVAVGDYDNDGYPDIYVTNFGRNVLYHNNGNGTFTDVTEKAGVGAGGWSVSAGFLDYDNDGRLDLFVGRYLDWDFSKHVYCSEPFHTYCPPDKHPPMTNILYHNNGDGTFKDVSRESGIAAKPGAAMGLAINDYDGDGFADIFVTNDDRPHFLYHNKGDGTFEEVALEAGVAYTENGATVSGMGASFADYDNDGLPDIVLTDLATEIYQLYRNKGRDGFMPVSRVTGLTTISAMRSGWGVQFMDYDNDGWKDLFISQSHVIDNIQMLNPQLVYELPPLLLRNEKGKKFSDVSAQSGPVFHEAMAGRGVAVGDLDNDGALDVVINVLNGSPRLLYNSVAELGNHWLVIKLVGTVSNRDGQGAVVVAQGASGLKQWQYATTCGSYLSAQDPRVHFGLGSDESARIEVRWPSGICQILENVRTNQILTVTEPLRNGGNK
jgi:hypothetical protein